MDLLAILPYYIEIALQKDTVSLFPSNPPIGYLIRCCTAHPQSTLFRFSILRTFRLLRVFRPFRYNSTLLLCVLFFIWCLLCLLMRDRVNSVRSRSCTSLSDVRETHSWPSDSLYSWSSSCLAPFCTCAPFPRYIAWSHLEHVKVFYRARFVGRYPRSFHQLGWRSISVCGESSFARALSYHVSNGAHASPYPLQRGT
jgi:hypothetical protein